MKDHIHYHIYFVIEYRYLCKSLINTHTQQSNEKEYNNTYGMCWQHVGKPPVQP